MESIQSVVAQGLEIVTFVIEVLAAIILVLGAARFLITLLREGFEAKGHLSRAFRDARLKLGTYILAGLEFMIVADILFTIVHRTLQDVIVLGLIVGVRTLISVFLNREIKELRGLEKEPS
ncbi:MAG: DUF1622 domain-containing protein [Parvularcula sp.]|jgi:uncharacterized membrane protein|nr:DUF1622 domain-containing protein [Parvularcula sp.]